MKMNNTSYIKSLNTIRVRDFSEAGSKAVNLGELISAGISVPDGFVVLTTAYEEFMQSNGILKMIHNTLEEIDTEQYQALEAAEMKISAIFEKASIPNEIVDEISYMYREFHNCPVVIRSSSTAEDLPSSSFAGQYESYLNITGIDDICAAIKQCWLSIWNARAITYRLKNGILNDKISLGVMIQKLIKGEKAGICFTANPLNGRRDQTLINASWGLGEAVVNSLVTPDQWLLDKASGNILNSTISIKTVKTITMEKGTLTVDVPLTEQKKSTLTNEEIHELFDVGTRIENHFKGPQDIEWVYQNSKFYIVQVRPITSLFPIPKNPLASDDRLRIFINMNLVDQGLSEPFTPMGADIWKVFLKYMTSNMSEYIVMDGRIFADPSEKLRSKSNWNNLAFYFESRDPIATKALLQWLQRNEKAFLGKGNSPKMSFKDIMALMGFLGKIIYGKFFRSKARNKMIKKMDAVYENHHSKSKTLKEFDQKLTFVDEFIKQYAILTMSQAFYAIPAVLADIKAEKLIKSWLNDTNDLDIFRKSLPYNKTTEMGIELLTISADLISKDTQPSPDVPEIQDFLCKYGHRANIEIDAGIPRWHEEPTYIINLIKSYMEQGNPEEKLQKYYKNSKESKEAELRIIHNVRRKKGILASMKMKRLLHLINEMLGMREFPKFQLVKEISLVRDILKSMGDDLVKMGKLDNAEDIFYLSMNDFEVKNNLQSIVTKNKKEYDCFSTRLITPRLISSTGEAIYSLDDEKADSLKGIPVSSGVYQGKIKIAYTPSEADLKPGEILVVQCANPAWTPLYLNAGALIMETGGALSHGAIVAREYGIPTVAGVNNATTLLKNGQIVRVNGQSGQIVLIE